jgi:hypothetical protein
VATLEVVASGGEAQSSRRETGSGCRNGGVFRVWKLRNGHAFGKYRGTPVTKLPFNYLQWLLGLELLEPLRTVVKQEHRRLFDQSRWEGPIDLRVIDDLILDYFIQAVPKPPGNRGRRVEAKIEEVTACGRSEDRKGLPADAR